MKIALFSNKTYTQNFMQKLNESYGHKIEFFEQRLNPETAHLAEGFGAVCAFVNDDLGEETIEKLSEGGVKTVALRCAGYNNVDLCTAKKHDIKVVRVPAYSPNAVAEHTIAMILALNRNLCRARSRVREGNFELQGLLGFDLSQSKVGIIGTGKIGEIVLKILKGFECELYAYDPYINEECEKMGVKYLPLDELLKTCNIISLHCPLVKQTHHIIDADAINQMCDNVMLINTSRGALIDTKAAIEGLKSGKIGYLGLDVYEEEEELFFEDLSNEIITDDTFARLLMFPNVLVTGHQAFFTKNALEQIADTTLSNVAMVERGEECPNQICPKCV
ncbi:2-hydroxyacid dehydrogenase [Sedimentisphaera salicampi]|uniref:2-hydroxyacid dehydrogenase n=1 Tax=Sedimentisphaera salicampi TaxID=1941349 RepID=UPI000B9A5D0D|nr:2-hydroxyacid dehydrogenase [Sedimentisphaera salicampi]OXU15423.1 D-lactate dehydrogenase [Sedimentisphaera salicampi]